MTVKELLENQRHKGSSTIKKIIRDYNLEGVISEFNIKNGTQGLSFSAQV